MRNNTRRILSWVLATALLLTCTISGLVLPAAAESDNLLVNGDFEQGGTGWGTSSSATFAEGDGKDGSKGLKLATEVLEGGASVYPGVYYKGEFHAILEPNTTYIFSFDYKHEGKGWGRVNVLRKGSDWTGWATTPNLTATEWTTYSVEFTTGAAENMNASTGWEWKPEQIQYANAPGTGATYFDNFKLIKKPSAATGITLDKTAATVEVGKEIELKASATPAGATLPAVTWTTGDASVATVDGGKVKGVAVGATTITATAEGMAPVTCTVTVEAAKLLANGDFEQGASVAWGGSAYVAAGNGKDGSFGLKFETTVNEGESAKTPGAYYKGAFNSILKPNTTYIFSFDYKHEGKGWGQLDVVYGGTDWTGWKDTNLPSNVDWTRQTFEFTTGAADKMNIKEGWEWQLRAVHYANADNYGSAVTQFDNVTLVEKPKEITATGIVLDKTTATLEVGANTTLNVSVVPDEAPMPEITWTSSDETVATVANGVVTGVKAGTATITATADGLPAATCTVTVKEQGLIVNGDLEQGASVAWGGSSYVQNGVGKDGSIGIKFETTTQEGEAAKTPGVYYKGAFNSVLKPNTTYIFSFDYKHEGKGWGQIDVVYGGTDWTGWKDTNLPSNVDWTRQTFEFTTGAADKMNIKEGWEWQIRLVHYSNAANWGSASAQFDNFELIEKPKEITATGIVLDKTTATLEVGADTTLNVSVVPGEASMPEITWTSSDETVAKVEDGKITALKAGTATITATAGTLTATCTVTVKEQGLIVNGDFEQGVTGWENTGHIMEGVGKDGSWGIKIATEVLEGQSAKYPGPYYKNSFVGKLKPNTTYIFSFDYKHEGKGFAQLNVVNKPADWTGWANSGNLTATEWTTVTIEFTTGDAANLTDAKMGWEWMPRHVHYANAANYGQGAAYFDNFTLVEKPKKAEPTGIVLDKTTASLEVDGTTTLTVTVTPAEAEMPEITWTSSDEAVAKVEDGKITALKAGTATITATAGTLTATCVVTVTEPVNDGNLLINGNFEKGTVGWENTGHIMEGVGKDGSWGIKIATEVLEGQSAKYPGPYYKNSFVGKLKPNTKYIFTFDYKHEGKGFAQLNVVNKPADWTGWVNSGNLTATEWTTVTIEFTTGDAANLTDAKMGWEWMPRHVHYANAANYGQGAAYFDNFKLVEKVVVSATEIKLDKNAATLEEGQTTKLTVTAEPENAEKPVIVWSTSNADVATVADGVVTAVAEGTATITATFGELTATCAITVIKDDGNIIINGDFENGTDSWGRDQAQKDRIQAGVGKDGSAGLKLSTDITADSTAHQTPGTYYLGEIIAALKPDTIYEFSFDYKHEGMGFGQIMFNVVPGKLPNGADFKNTSLASGDKDWTTMTYTITTPSAMPKANTGWEWQMRQVQYYDKGVGAGVSYYDNFKLVEVGKVVHADELIIAPETLEILPFDSASVGVMTSPVGASTGVLTWTSADPSIAEVDAKGKVTAKVASGETTITVTNDKGKTATAKVIVTEYGNLFKNGDFEQGAANWDTSSHITPGAGRDGSTGVLLKHESTSGWSSYYYKGSFVGLLEPATTYQFSVDYYSASKDSSVRLWTGTMGLTISNDAVKYGTSEWRTITKTFTTPTDLAINTGWDFSLVCEKTGTEPVVLDNITLKKYSSGVDAESLTMNLSTLTLIPGRTGALSVHAFPVEADLNDMVWTTSDPNVAIVEYGVVTGVGKGKATITASKNGLSASCEVTVSGNEVLLQNGNFDKENDTSWTLENGAAITAEEGRLETNGLALVAGSSAKQVFKGLKPDTTYQVFLHYRGGVADVKLTNGETVLLESVTASSSLWKKQSFEFTTPETLESDETTLTLSTAKGTIYVDNVILAVKASLIDFVVSDIIWDGGGYQVKNGTELTFAITLTNKGEDPVLKDAVIEVDMCKNGETFQTITYKLPVAMNPQDSVVMISETPWVAEEGDWVISARANPNLAILELNDSNNAAQVNLRVSDTIFTAPEEALAFDMTELTFNDEFDSYTSIDTMGTGKDGYKWYVNRAWSAGMVQQNSYTITDGVIKLHDQNPVFNITMGTMDPFSGAGWSYTFGYLETKLRIVRPNYHEYLPGASGGIPAIWSLPVEKWTEQMPDRPGCQQWVEMDWLEYWGRDLERWPQYPDGYYTVTLHDQITGRGEEDHWKVNGNSYKNGLGDAEWHIMGWLWTYNGVIAYVDHEEVFRISYSEDGTPSCSVRTQSGIIDDLGAFSYMNYQDLVLYIAGAHDHPMELDYVRIWQGGNKSMPDPEDPSGDVIVDMEAEDFWYNYCTDDWGDPIATVTAENYQNILNGKELWDKLTPARKEEINAYLESLGQPTYEDLLADALIIAGGGTIEEPDAPDTPDTGDSARAVPAVAMVALLSASALWISRKRRTV